MKIIINQPRASYFVGGAEMISFDHAINLLKLNNEIYYFTINPMSVGLKHSIQFEKFYKKYHEQIHIVEIDQDSIIKYIYDIEPGEDRTRWNVESIFYNQRLYEYLNNHSDKYDVIFSYYNLDSVFVPRDKINQNVLYLCGIPRNQNDFQGSFLYAYDKIIAISNEVKLAWKKYAKNGISVVSTGVDCDRFSLKDFERKNTIDLLYIGRLINRKNIDKIIKAYKKIYNKYNVRLRVVGDGPDRKRLECIFDKCLFTGVVANTEDYYKTSDIFITPSKYGEGLQGTILEAMSCGLTVVATNTKINSKLLSNNRGFLCEPNTKSIVESITSAINSNREKTALRNRKYIINKYSWEIKAKELLEVLK